MALYRGKTGAIFNSVKTDIQNSSTEDLDKKIVQYFLSKVSDGDYKTLFYCFCGLGMYLNKELVGHDKDDISKNIKIMYRIIISS